MLIWFGLPLALIAAAAFFSHRMIRRHTDSPGRVALGFLGAEIGAAALASAGVWVRSTAASRLDARAAGSRSTSSS